MLLCVLDVILVVVVGISEVVATSVVVTFWVGVVVSLTVVTGTLVVSPLPSVVVVSVVVVV